MSVLPKFDIRCDTEGCEEVLFNVAASCEGEAREGAACVGWTYTAGRDRCPVHECWSYRDELDGLVEPRMKGAAK